MPKMLFYTVNMTQLIIQYKWYVMYIFTLCLKYLNI